jgi:glycine betaine/choline ABC-type transport system substrate-binding protein
MENRLISLLCLSALFFSACAPPHSTLRIGSKNFAEQLVLGEWLAQRLEKNYPGQVERRFGFGSTGLIHQALASGEIDLYIEYSGTAAEAILQLPPLATPALIRDAYAQRFQAEWLEPLGFNNSYVAVVRADGPAEPNLTALTSQAPHLRAGLNAEFLQRPDGYPALQKVYGLKFGQIVTLDVGLLYPAIDAAKVDVIVAFSTDGRLTNPGYRTVADDRHALPRYDATPVVRTEALRRFPNLRTLLQSLSGTLNDATMRQLNARAELEKQSPAEIARDYWTNHPAR